MAILVFFISSPLLGRRLIIFFLYPSPPPKIKINSQDQMFSEEVRRNPDLAHLARGRPRTAGGVPVRRAAGGGGAAQPPDIDVAKALGNLGSTAKRQFQNLAAQFNAKVKAAQQNLQGGGAGGAGGAAAAGGATGEAHERRGLLDDGDDGEEVALEFASRKDL